MAFGFDARRRAAVALGSLQKPETSPRSASGDVSRPAGQGKNMQADGGVIRELLIDGTIETHACST